MEEKKEKKVKINRPNSMPTCSEHGDNSSDINQLTQAPANSTLTIY